MGLYRRTRKVLRGRRHDRVWRWDCGSYCGVVRVMGEEGETVEEEEV